MKDVTNNILYVSHCYDPQTAYKQDDYHDSISYKQEIKKLQALGRWPAPNIWRAYKAVSSALSCPCLNATT